MSLRSGDYQMSAERQPSIACPMDAERHSSKMSAERHYLFEGSPFHISIHMYAYSLVFTRADILG